MDGLAPRHAPFDLRADDAVYIAAVGAMNHLQTQQCAFVFIQHWRLVGFAYVADLDFVACQEHAFYR